MRLFFIFDYVVLYLLLTCKACEGRDLWVDANNGNDNNSGVSSLAAWKTIAQASASVQPGDTVNILPGVYREELIPPSGTSDKPITYRAVEKASTFIRGSNAIKGFQPYTGTSPSFLNAGGNVWWADLPGYSFGAPQTDGTVSQKVSPYFIAISRDGGSLDPSDRLILAREPDYKVVTDWKRAEYWWRGNGGSAVGGDETSSTTQLTDTADDSEPSDIEAGNLKSINVDLTGGMLWSLDSKDSHWIWYRRIRSHNRETGTITIDARGKNNGCEAPAHLCNVANADTNGKGFGWLSKYYVENLPGLLDQPGEYWVDKSANPPRLYLKPPTGVVMSNDTEFEVGWRLNVLDLTGKSHLRFDGLIIEMAEGFAVNINNWNGLETLNIQFTNMEVKLSQKGFLFLQSINANDNQKIISNILLENSTVHHLNEIALDIHPYYGDCTTPSDRIDDKPGCAHAVVTNLTIRNNEFYELAFKSENPSGTGGGGQADHLQFVNNHIHHVAHNGMQFSPGKMFASAPNPPTSPTHINTGTVLIKDNIFEWACILESDCGGLKLFAGTGYFRDHLIMGNVFRNNIGWSVPVQVHYTKSLDGKPAPVGSDPNDFLWYMRVGFAFGLYHDYAPGTHVFRNIAYDNSKACYQWTNKLNAWKVYFWNNLAANCYWGVATDFENHPHIETSFGNNMFISGQRQGLQLIRQGVENGAGAFEGNFSMDYDIFYQNGWDDRCTCVWRRGNVETGKSENNDGSLNALRTLEGIRAEKVGIAVHSKEVDPLFENYDVTASRTETWQMTVSEKTWTSFMLSSQSPATDSGSDIPPDLVRVLSLWGLNSGKYGGAMDIGPLEYGINWKESDKGCGIANGNNSASGTATSIPPRPTDSPSSSISDEVGQSGSSVQTPISTAIIILLFAPLII